MRTTDKMENCVLIYLVRNLDVVFIKHGHEGIAFLIYGNVNPFFCFPTRPICKI
jgi:hypothetical protein